MQSFGEPLPLEPPGVCVPEPGPLPPPIQASAPKEWYPPNEHYGLPLTSLLTVAGALLMRMVQNYNEFYIGPQVAIIFESMLVAVGFVLLIACANIANVTLRVLSC